MQQSDSGADIKVLSIVANRYATFYQEQSRALEQNGVNITHVSPPKQSPDPGEQQEITRNSLDYIKLYHEVIKRSIGEYDLIHANFGLTAPHAIAQPRRPIVLSLWGSDLAGRLGFLSKTCLKLCDEVIVMSQVMNNEIRGGAHVIPHGIDMERFRPMPQRSAREAVGWSPEKMHVLFPYDPSRSVKNYPLAKQVTEAVNKKLSSKVKLQIVFDVDHDSVPLYMNAADALLLTSCREGSPNTVKEAMACRLPVIATDVGDVRERLANVALSRVCTTEDELIKALFRVLNREKRPNSRKHIQHLSLDQMGERITTVYKKALN